MRRYLFVLMKRVLGARTSSLIRVGDGSAELIALSEEEDIKKKSGIRTFSIHLVNDDLGKEPRFMLIQKLQQSLHTLRTFGVTVPLCFMYMYALEQNGLSRYILLGLQTLLASTLWLYIEQGLNRDKAVGIRKCNRSVRDCLNLS